MVQAVPGADQLHGAADGKQVSGSRSAMWPALVLSILTAIFAWIWYRGSGDRREQRVDRAVSAGAELSPPAADSWKPESCRQPAPDQRLGSPDTSRDRTEQHPEVNHKGLSAAEPLGRDDAIGDDLSELPPEKKLQEHPKREEPQDSIKVPPTDVLKREEPQDSIKVPPTDVPRRKGPQDGINASSTDVLKSEVSQANIQEHLLDVSEKEIEPVHILEQQTGAPMIENLSEEHLQDLMQTIADPSKNEVHNGEVHMYPSGIPEAREMLEDEGCPLLKKEVQLGLGEEYPQFDLDKATVQTAEEVMCLTMKEHGAQKFLEDSGHVSVLVQENGQVKELSPSINDGLDGVSGYETGSVFDNSLVMEEAVDLLKAKETLNQDPYLEMDNKSSHVNAIGAHQLMKLESVKKCDIKKLVFSDSIKPPTGLQDDADMFASGLKDSDKRLLDVQKLGTGPDGSPVDVCNLMFNQEKEMAGPGSPSTDEKTTLGSSSEENIHEIDHQKTRKIATIQPMPQNVNFAFKVHYITYSNSQIIAVTGDHEKLGKWEAYVPLTSGKGGFWSHSITLPADTNLSWKFVVVENGKIKRWEECNNRILKIAHEDIEARLYWGYP